MEVIDVAVKSEDDGSVVYENLPADVAINLIHYSNAEK